MWRLLPLIDTVLPKGIEPKGSSWRTNAKYFQQDDGRSPTPGIVNMSPAWFQQGKDVCHLFLPTPQNVDEDVIQTNDFLLEVSAPLKHRTTEAACNNWLKDMMETSALIGAILSIIHPDLYARSRETLLALMEKPGVMKEFDLFMEVMKSWSSVFSGMSVVSGRQCPVHRDVQAMHSWFDILATFGEYTDGRMELPSLGLRLEYNPGTIVGLAGRVVSHGVAETEGKRACLAYFMREKVHERAGVKAPGWANLDAYNS